LRAKKVENCVTKNRVGRMNVNTHIFFFGLIAFPKTKLIISLPVTGLILISFTKTGLMIITVFSKTGLIIKAFPKTGLILISFTKTGLKMTLFPKKNQLHTQ
jgi:hypothetical protein